MQRHISDGILIFAAARPHLLVVQSVETGLNTLPEQRELANGKVDKDVRGIHGQLFFFAADFFVVDFFLGATFAPDLRASLKAMATACFRFFTLARPPDFNWPCLYSRMTLPTFAFPLADVFFLDALFLAATILLLFEV
jgi:hypothetical protein